MQNPEPLNDDWMGVSSSVRASDESLPIELVPAMLQVANACAAAVRSVTFEPLTQEEQQILDEELAEDPRLYELLIKRDLAEPPDYVLEWYGNGISAVTEFLNGDNCDFQKLSKVSVQCWDYILPEYRFHQLSHLAALIAAQIVSTQLEFHSRTWLFQMTNSQRWALFLGLAQELDVLEPAEVRELANRLAVGGQ